MTRKRRFSVKRLADNDNGIGIAAAVRLILYIEMRDGKCHSNGFVENFQIYRHVEVGGKKGMLGNDLIR